MVRALRNWGLAPCFAPCSPPGTWWLPASVSPSVSWREKHIPAFWGWLLG